MGKSNLELPAPGLCRFYAACYIGVSPRTLDSMRAEGIGPHHFRIGDEVRYWPKDLDRHLAVTPKHAALAEIFRKRAIVPFNPHLELIPDEEDLLTTPKAARALGVCVRTMSYWRAAGTGPKFVKVKGRVRYLGRDIREYVEFDRQGGAS
ncbi:helix-turn-helix domain-containing protein [Lysobacter sp. A6]|uniref:Helix-turn-helix domain-containing protein n=1 Tax=Noviluteimonas lactosilytica TaxID=2888523 RepID=A0ABS8JGA6_9GAMM|nr:helix-turn-helix domain-containing protein [Lysobacter lactosilyticus]MCC8362646.1 helix-turn-helix domain-containing protein [Lysobacter lactosilyticus]